MEETTLALATIAEAFRATADAHPDRVAVRTKDDEVSLTWSELRDRVDALAGGLAQLGVRRGDTVALMLSNRPEFHIADLAVMTLGATPFSIYQTFTREQIEYVVGDAGARVALLQAADAITFDELDDDETTGARIILRSLEEPLRQISHNAGLEGSVVVNDVRKAKKGQGLNAATGEIVDLVAAGIIDPAMVTRSALQNAASIAKNILTTEAIVAEAPEKQSAGAGMPDMGGMGGMM